LQNVLREVHFPVWATVASFRAEDNTATIHGFAHSVARVIGLDHLRIADQLEKAGVRLNAAKPES